MSFLRSLFGGSEQSSTSNASSGYSTIPYPIRSGFDKLGTAVSEYTDPNRAGVLDRFTPLAQTADETAAYDAIRGGFAPTQQSLNTDLSMLMNPFNDYVIGGINNQANSNYSILKQAMNEAGQFGSNRQVLGANDIELQRQNQIGSMLQGQYNQALGQIFNNLVPQRQQDAANLMNIGDRSRMLDLQTKQAPITALQTGTSMIAPFNSSASTGYSQGTSDAGIIPGLAKLSQGVGTAVGAFTSDINLKENIKPLGTENGHNIYEFSYKGDKRRFKGVMAQEVLWTNPDAVIKTPQGLMVNYDKIGVKFCEVQHG